MSVADCGEHDVTPDDDIVIRRDTDVPMTWQQMSAALASIATPSPVESVPLPFDPDEVDAVTNPPQSVLSDAFLTPLYTALDAGRAVIIHVQFSRQGGNSMDLLVRTRVGLDMLLTPGDGNSAWRPQACWCVSMPKYLVEGPASLAMLNQFWTDDADVCAEYIDDDSQKAYRETGRIPTCNYTTLVPLEDAYGWLRAEHRRGNWVVLAPDCWMTDIVSCAYVPMADGTVVTGAY